MSIPIKYNIKTKINKNKKGVEEGEPDAIASAD